MYHQYVYPYETSMIHPAKPPNILECETVLGLHISGGVQVGAEDVEPIFYNVPKHYSSAGGEQNMEPLGYGNQRPENDYTGGWPLHRAESGGYLGWGNLGFVFWIQNGL